jgi:hypothetical protein
MRENLQNVEDDGVDKYNVVLVQYYIFLHISHLHCFVIFNNKQNNTNAKYVPHPLPPNICY